MIFQAIEGQADRRVFRLTDLPDVDLSMPVRQWTVFDPTTESNPLPVVRDALAVNVIGVYVNKTTSFSIAAKVFVTTVNVAAPNDATTGLFCAALNDEEP